MRVGYFVETPVEHNLTGGVRSFLNLAEELMKHGVEPYVVTSEEWAFTEILTKMGIPFITAKMFRPFVGVTEHVRFEREKYWIKTTINNRAKRKAIKWFKENKVQLIHINSQFAGIVGAQVAQRLKLPYIYHIREFLEEHFHVRFYKETLVKNYVASADKVVGISRAIQDYYAQRFNREIELVYNGIPCREKNCVPCDTRLEGQNIDVAIVGRITPEKGQFEAIKAIELLKYTFGYENILLHIIGFVGSSPYEGYLQKYVNDKNLPVRFHQFTNSPEEILNNCDIGLTCSEAEAFGRVTVEYMYAGLFAIGKKAGGTPEIIINNETGLLYEQSDEQELAKKIEWVINNREKAKEMLQNGQKRAQQCFSIRTTAINVYKLYEELMGNRS